MHTSKKTEDMKLVDHLLEMADDIQIGGDHCFRILAHLVREEKLSARQKRKVRAMLKRCVKLISAMSDLTDELPSVEYHLLYQQ